MVHNTIRKAPSEKNEIRKSPETNAHQREGDPLCYECVERAGEHNQHIIRTESYARKALSCVRLEFGDFPSVEIHTHTYTASITFDVMCARRARDVCDVCTNTWDPAKG